eukprot:jgi/Ulvmu1/4627/UM002_0358.1
MTARSKAVSEKSFHGRRRVSDVAREHSASKPARESQQRSKRGSSSKSGTRRSSKRQCAQKPCRHLDYGALIHIFKRCDGISRANFGLVNKLWNKVQHDASLHHVSGSTELRRLLEEEVKPYDTVVLAPGMYKERVLCEVPVRLIGCTSTAVDGRACMDRLCASGAIHGGAVILWQERAPAILVNADTCYCENIIVRVVHASHEYSCIAYGPGARSITLEGCSIMGGTGLRIPYSVDPLRLLYLNMQNCVVRDVKGGLSGVTVVSGQLDMRSCTVHDCSYGVEVGVDAHACISGSSICFTECALMCEGHMALTGCKIWGNVATWHGWPLVMEDNRSQQSIEVRSSRRGSGAAALSSAPAAAPATPVIADQAVKEVGLSPPDTVHNVRAGICNGRHSDCMIAGRAAVSEAGVRQHAQVRLNDCEVDYNRLTSSVAHDDLDLQRHHRHIRRLMRETYGPPDQDYEGWHVIGWSDMESDGSDDADVVMPSDEDESDDDIPLSSEDDESTEDEDDSDEDGSDDFDSDDDDDESEGDEDQ